MTFLIIWGKMSDGGRQVRVKERRERKEKEREEEGKWGRESAEKK